MSIKILHTADWHLGKKLDHFSRLEEQVEVMNEICEIADQQEVDVVIVAGDLFDTFNPSADAQDLFLKIASFNSQPSFYIDSRDAYDKETVQILTGMKLIHEIEPDHFTITALATSCCHLAFKASDPCPIFSTYRENVQLKNLSTLELTMVLRETGWTEKQIK